MALRNLSTPADRFYQRYPRFRESYLYRAQRYASRWYAWYNYGNSSNSNMPRLRSGRNVRYHPYRRPTRGRSTRGSLRSTGRVSTRRAIRSGQGVTDHYDKKTIYRKRRMPFGRRRRWKKWVRKVTAVSEKTLGARTWVRNGTVDISYDLKGTSTVGPTALVPNAEVQKDGMCCLYGVEGTTALGSNDLQLIFNSFTGDSHSTAYIFQSGIMDMTFTNTSYALVSQEPDVFERWNVRLEVDVYECTGNRQFAVGGTGKNLIDLFNEGQDDTNPDNLPNVKPYINYRGTSPWDQTQALAQWGIKIWKKTKYMLFNGESATYQFRDPRRHVIQKKVLDETLGTNLPGKTKWILFIIKAAAGYNTYPEYDDYVAAVANLTIGCTRKYMFKVNSTATKIGSYDQAEP